MYSRGCRRGTWLRNAQTADLYRHAGPMSPWGKRGVISPKAVSGESQPGGKFDDKATSHSYGLLPLTDTRPLLKNLNATACDPQMDSAEIER